LTSIKFFDLISDIVRDILRIKLLLPNTKVVWSNILMRRYWHGADDGTAVERARKRVSCAVKKELIPEGFCVIRHLNIRAREKKAKTREIKGHALHIRRLIFPSPHGY
jgi:hypothetical protein